MPHEKSSLLKEMIHREKSSWARLKGEMREWSQFLSCAYERDVGDADSNDVERRGERQVGKMTNCR